MPKGKSQWEQDYLQQQARINGYARSLYQPRLREVDKILISHPDEHREYLRQHPCRGCGAEACCDTPCQAYLKWYNARMGAARVRAKM